MTSLEGQLVNSRMPEIWCKQLMCVFRIVLYEQIRIAATRLDWTAVILNISKTNGPLSMVGHLKCTVKWCIQDLLRPKEGFEQPPRNLPAYQSDETLCLCQRRGGSSVILMALCVCDREGVELWLYSWLCVNAREGIEF